MEAPGLLAGGSGSPRRVRPAVEAPGLLAVLSRLCAAGTLCVDAAPRPALLIVNSDVRDVGLDRQLRSMLQWVAASVADIPHILLSPDRELQQVNTLTARFIPSFLFLIAAGVTG